MNRKQFKVRKIRKTVNAPACASWASGGETDVGAGGAYRASPRAGAAAARPCYQNGAKHCEIGDMRTIQRWIVSKPVAQNMSRARSDSSMHGSAP